MSGHTNKSLEKYQMALKGRGSRKDLMRLAETELQLERDKAERARHAKMEEKAKEERWKSYGINGKGFVTTGLQAEYWKWKGEPTPDTVLSYQYATGRAAYPHKQIMNSIKYPCGPVAFADEQQYPWRPGFDPKAEENRRKMLLKREKELYLELNPPPPTDKKSLRYLRDKLRSAAFFINGVNLDTLFRHYDLDNNGILDVEEFTFALRKDCGLAEDEVSQEEIQQIFDSIDIDLSGEIDAAEFKAWLDDQELNPYLKVYERAVTLADSSQQPRPTHFRDPRSHNMISKGYLFHKAKLWESFNKGESSFAFDLEEDRAFSDSSGRFLSPFFHDSNAYYMAFRAIDMPTLEECREVDRRVYQKWREQSDIRSQLEDLCQLIRDDEDKIEALLHKMSATHLVKQERRSAHSLVNRSRRGSFSNGRSREGSFSSRRSRERSSSGSRSRDGSFSTGRSREGSFSASREREASLTASELGGIEVESDLESSDEGDDFDGDLDTIDGDASSAAESGAVSLGSVRSFNATFYKAAKRQKMEQDRAMNSVVTLRASIKQAKIEIDRLSALFDPTGLQDDVGDLSFIPPSFYFARAQAAVEEEQRRKEAEAATQRKKQPQWAGNKAELFKTIRQRLVAQAYVAGGVDLASLFRFYDKDNSGELDFEEFCEAIRKQARISAEEIPDDGLQIIFDDVDADGGGTVDILEFVEWLDPDTNTGEASVRLRAIELSQQKSLEEKSERWKLVYNPVIVRDDATYEAWKNQVTKQEKICKLHQDCLVEVERLEAVRRKKQHKLMKSREGSASVRALLDDALAEKASGKATSPLATQPINDADRIYALVKLRVFGRSKEFKHLCRCLRKYIHDPVVQLDGVKAVWLFAQSSPTKPVDVVQQTRKQLCDSGAIGAVVRALATHPGVFELATWGLQCLCALLRNANAVSKLLTAEGLSAIQACLKQYHDVEEVWDLGTKCIFECAEVTSIAIINRAKAIGLDQTLLRSLFRFKDATGKSLWQWNYVRPLLKMMGRSEREVHEERMANTLMKAKPSLLPVFAKRFAAKKVRSTNFKDKQRLFSKDKRVRKQVRRLMSAPDRS